jgi:hypothetical protein
MVRMTARVIDRLRADGDPRAEQAAAALAERRQAGMGRAEYAAYIGVDEPALAALEDGTPPA